MNDRTDRPATNIRGSGFLWSFVLALPLAAALIVFIAQNTGDVTVHWTVWKITTPLAVVVLVTVFVAVAVAELVGLIWRHRRRRHIARREAGAVAARQPEPPPEEPGAEEGS